MADILTSKIQVPSLPDDTLILKDVEARNDLSTALATVTGNPLNFSTRSAQKANETVISLEPIQDLHGYGYPWPAGGGKNKLPIIIDEIKAVNTRGTWNGNVYTYNGITYTFILDADGNIIGINASGTASNTSFFGVKFNIADNISIVGNGCPAGGSTLTNSYRMDVRQNTVDGSVYDNVIDGGSGTKKFATGGNTLYFSIRIAANYELPTAGLLFQPMIRLATETDPTFAPYSNYCPIDGRTETSLVGCGKNELENGVQDGSYSTITVTKNDDGSLTVNGTTSRNTIVIGNIQAGVYGYGTDQNDGIKHLSNGNYVASMSLDGGSYITGVALQIYATNNTVGTIGNLVQIATTGNTGYVKFEIDNTYLYNWCRIMLSAGTYNNVKIYPMVRLFTETNPTYEPFVESNNLTIQFGEKVYGAKVELEKGTVTVDRAIVDIGDLLWTYSSDSNVFYNTSLSNKKIGNANLISSAYKTSAVSSVNNMNNGEIKGNATAVYVYIKDLRYTDATTFAQELAGQKIVYELATPYTIALTPNEISLLSGVNVISSDADGIKLTYRDGKVATLGDLDGLVKKIADCEDVEITDPQASDVLVWDSTAGKWKNQQSTSMVVYDGTERVIGTWFGETLYQKVIDVPSFGSGYTSVTHDLGIKNYVNAFGCCAVNGETDMVHNFPFIQASNSCSIGVHGADSFSLVSSWNNCKAKICIQYTKNNS